MTTTEKIPDERLRTDGGTQPRAAIHLETCQEYAEAMQTGEQFPAGEVYFDGEHYWLADGFHRLFAHRKARPGEPIECIVYQGTLEDAQWHSYGVNKTHGLRRTNRDKERAVRAALSHAKGPALSDRQISEHVGVHYNTVVKYRQKLQGAGTITNCDSRTGRDGRTIETANIGRKPRRVANGKPSRHMASLIQKPTRSPSPVEKMTAVSLPHNPAMGARTLIEVFDCDYLRALVAEVTTYLDRLAN